MHFIKSVYLNIENMIYMHSRESDIVVAKWGKKKETSQMYQDITTSGEGFIKFQRKVVTHPRNGEIEILEPH